MHDYCSILLSSITTLCCAWCAIEAAAALTVYYAAGEYISPEYIESVLITAPAVEQIWVTGQSDKSAVVAIVVPSLEGRDVDNTTPAARASFCQSRQALAMITAQLQKASTDAKLKVGWCSLCMIVLQEHVGQWNESIRRAEMSVSPA